MLIAGLDIGSNSCRYTLVHWQKNQGLRVVEQDMATTRLGKGMAGGILLPEAIERTVEAITGFVERARQKGAEKILGVATAAVREAANGQELLDRLVPLSAEITCIDGQREGWYSWLGAVQGLGLEKGDGVMVIDSGGGSTEFSWLEAGQLKAISLKIGAVRATEEKWSLAEIDDFLAKGIASIPVKPEKVILVGGTATTLGAMELQLEKYQPSLVHGLKLSAQQVAAWARRLRELNLEERKQLPGLQPARADIIPAGASILAAATHQLGTEQVWLSETDLLYGQIYIYIQEQLKYDEKGPVKWDFS
ncbi:exopolyphosphatase / guanosine-5'-triphosphate,3'-diphosphate pyrophosphatase [Carboxydocella thermautotrophica]|nr:exopolyphosphatase / guanosine-5'-triphosphate,3'-diphosphate pyrophosphatase [Carboxydocella thermautotrophica]